MTLKTPQAVFGGLSMIAIAIYFGPGSQSIQAHDNATTFLNLQDSEHSGLKSRLDYLEEQTQKKDFDAPGLKDRLDYLEEKTEEHFDAILKNSSKISSLEIKLLVEKAERALEDFHKK
jgi:hypothetical protein